MSLFQRLFSTLLYVVETAAGSVLIREVSLIERFHCICVCLYRHDRVLEAVTVNGELCNIARFDPVLTALKKTNNPMLQLACLQFINAIVNTPDDIDFKLHLRNEFMRGGLGDMLLVSYK